MRASVRSLPPRRRWSPPVVAHPRACCSSSEPGHDAGGRAPQRPPPPPHRSNRYICDPTEPASRTERGRRADHPAAHERKAKRAAPAGKGWTRGRASSARRRRSSRGTASWTPASRTSQSEPGLSHGSFYHYFESKEEVFRRGGGRGRRAAERSLNNVILDPTSSATPYERIHEAIRLHLEAYRDEARIMGVIEQVWRFDEQFNAITPNGIVATPHRSRTPSTACSVMGSLTDDSIRRSPPTAWGQ